MWSCSGSCVVMLRLLCGYVEVVVVVLCLVISVV